MADEEAGKEWVIDQAKRISKELGLQGEFEWRPQDDKLNFPLAFKQHGIQRGPPLRIDPTTILFCASEPPESSRTSTDPELQPALKEKLRSWLNGIKAAKR